jgi:hypothetical protein
MAPLAVMQVYGISPDSKAYRNLAARLAARGIDLAPAGAAAGGTSDFQTPLVGGASVATLLSQGDLWAGAAGTVTYTNGDVVVAYGHPLLWVGSTALDLNNAWVHGIWGDIMEPYKIISPGKLRGTLTQDRSAGVAGRTDVLPVQVPVTSRATLDGRVQTSESELPQWVADSADWSFLASAAAFIPMQRATNQGSFAGSAATSATVVLSDGTQTYTVTHANLWDDPFDVTSLATGDLDTMLSMLTANADGVAPVMVESVDFTSDLSFARKAALILDVSAPGGLHVGDNQVLTTLVAYGQVLPQTVTTTLTIPSGTPTSGTLAVSPAAQSGGGVIPAPGSGTPGSPQTVPQIVAAIEALPKNSDLQAVYTPQAQVVPVGPAPTPSPGNPITVISPTDWVLSGSLQKPTAQLVLNAPGRVSVGQGAAISGSINPVVGDTTVALYKREAGQSSDTFVGSVPAHADGSGGASFNVDTGALTRTTRFTVTWGGDKGALGATAGVRIAVEARLGLTATQLAGAGHAVRLVAHLSPAQSAGKVVFERRLGAHWTRLGTVNAAGSPSMIWHARSAGRYLLRARFSGSSSNAATLSRTLMLKVR